MLPSEREQVILDYLTKHQTVSTARLCEVTGVSIATVRRDLNSLHRRGLLEKTHGGARYLPPPTAAVPPALPHQNDPAFADKDAIARTAAGFIYPGDIVFLGAGKTCTLIAHHIREKKNITIVTTNLNVVFELASSGNSMLLLGGDIHVGSNYVETLGEYTLEEMHGLYFDKVFLYSKWSRHGQRLFHCQPFPASPLPLSAEELQIPLRGCKFCQISPPGLYPALQPSGDPPCDPESPDPVCLPGLLPGTPHHGSLFYGGKRLNP